MLKIIQSYTLTHLIGQGQYGKVYHAYDYSDPNNINSVAIKMIHINKFISQSKLIQLTKRQIQILQLFKNNQNIVNFIDIIKTNKYVYLVFQYCNQGNLQEYLKIKGKLTEKQAIKIFKQLINAYKSLYQHNIIHRDIKTDNILFMNSIIKLADFGFCKRLKNKDDLTQTPLGSPLYMAPQILNNQVYTSKVDIWSCGIILYQMLFGSTPYANHNIRQLLNIYGQKSQIHFPLNKNQISPLLQKLLSRMLCKDQFSRITWEEFFYQYSFNNEGEILYKEKDFQYDLMKLMKRNSQNNNQENHKIVIKNHKFDWTQITQMNSSINSSQCQIPIEIVKNNKNKPYQHSYISNKSSIDKNQIKNEVFHQIFYLKHKIKQFQNQHSKVLQTINIIEQFIDSKVDYQYDSKILYFMMYNLNILIEQNIRSIQQYMKNKQNLVQKMPQQKQHLLRIQRIFSSQLNLIKSKINQIKTSLIALDNIGITVFKYPQKKVLRQIMKDFVQNYQIQNQNILQLSENGNKQNALKLLKILWVICLSDPLINRNNNKNGLISQNNILSIKEQTSKSQISALISRYLVKIGI